MYFIKQKKKKMKLKYGFFSMNIYEFVEHILNKIYFVKSLPISRVDKFDNLLFHTVLLLQFFNRIKKS